MTDVWVVIPTYNEAENLAELLDRTCAALAACRPPVRPTVLVVDDDSPDWTGALAEALRAQHPEVTVLHRAAKTGLGAAYRAGFARALHGDADIVLQLDADLSHDPEDLPRLIEAVRDGADVVLGSRYVPGGAVHGWPWHRWLLSRAGGAYASAVLGLGVSDPTGGLKAFRASTLRAIDLDTVASRGFAFQIETTYRAARAGRRIVELPITFRERRHGASKLTPSIAVEALWRVPLLRVHAAVGAAAERRAGAGVPPTGAGAH
jgi:dolichol-phosphate mannosyltransferase